MARLIDYHHSQVHCVARVNFKFFPLFLVLVLVSRCSFLTFYVSVSMMINRHTSCIRCNKRSFHIQKKTCASCGYPHRKLRSFNWSAKAKRRRTTGVGRMRYLKHVTRRAKNGFREGTVAKGKKSAQ
eukprot:TRINITY_DN3971_c0_g1_i1.p1 TRINITY_DN3971_c0_g1~~TRINITY_DN3971_c0_g1_i1.p1  ORF type:complete len:127 (-),score=18.20 TRINITY_DN3971_c0_g1_i1:18-398(-)